MSECELGRMDVADDGSELMVRIKKQYHVAPSIFIPIHQSSPRSPMAYRHTMQPLNQTNTTGSCSSRENKVIVLHRRPVGTMYSHTHYALDDRCFPLPVAEMERRSQTIQGLQETLE
jgi:hypothetical protein